MITIETAEANAKTFKDVSGLVGGNLYIDNINELFIYDEDASKLVYLGDAEDGDGCLLVDCHVSWPVHPAPSGTRVIIQQS